MSTRVVLTGATGFVGRVAAPRLLAEGFDLTCLHRRPPADAHAGRVAVVPSIEDTEGCLPWLEGREVVVHLAALAHRTDPRMQPTPDEFSRTNARWPVALANAAAKAGVRRFVFLSSIGVHGGSSAVPLGPTSDLRPVEPYAVSKLEAERGLFEVSQRTGLEVVIVRAPMVVGTNCTGNLLRLLRLVHRGYPLPFALARNLRSLVGVDNLADFLVLCCRHPRAAAGVLHVADTPDLSTPRMIELLASGMGRRARLLPVPMPLLRAAARLAGRHELLEKICGSLRVDTRTARVELGWTPARLLDTCLEDVGRWYAAQHG